MTVFSSFWKFWKDFKSIFWNQRSYIVYVCVGNPLPSELIHSVESFLHRLAMWSMGEAVNWKPSASFRIDTITPFKLLVLHETAKLPREKAFSKSTSLDKWVEHLLHCIQLESLAPLWFSFRFICCFAITHSRRWIYDRNHLWLQYHPLRSYCRKHPLIPSLTAMITVSFILSFL